MEMQRKQIKTISSAPTDCLHSFYTDPVKHNPDPNRPAETTEATLSSNTGISTT